MTDLPKSIGTGVVRILGVELHFHMLDNGQRIIEAEDVEALFAKMTETRLTDYEIDMLSRMAFDHEGEA
jgi:hypothetical protein